MNENVIEFLLGQDTATVTFSQKRYINRIQLFAKEKPEECQILAKNEDGSIVAHVPVSWIKIRPPRKIKLTEEERLEKRKWFLENVAKKRRKNNDKRKYK